MREPGNIRDEICFDGVNGLKSPEFIRAVRAKAYDQNTIGDNSHMAILASLCLIGPALEWFENLSDDVQSDWTLLRRALLEQFPASGEAPSKSVILTAGSPGASAEFIRHVRKHSQAEGKSQDDHWMAQYAAGCMDGDILKWHVMLDASVRNSWIQLERALLGLFPEPKQSALVPAGRVLVEKWERTEAPDFMHTNATAWLAEAWKRRAAYEASLPKERSSVYWLLVEGSEDIPEDAIQTGVDTDGDPLYSARVWVNGVLYPGKCGHHLRGPHVTIGAREMRVMQPYEVLVGNASAIRWVSNPWSPQEAGDNPPVKMKAFQAVEGGREVDGTALLLAQAYREGSGWQAGKVRPGWRWCAIGWADNTYRMVNFRVLVWAE